MIVKCDSTNVVKNSKNSAGSQQFFGKDCGKLGVMYPQYQRSKVEKEQILATYSERSTPSAVRGVARLYHISRNTLESLLKNK